MTFTMYFHRDDEMLPLRVSFAAEKVAGVLEIEITAVQGLNFEPVEVTREELETLRTAAAEFIS